LLEKVLKVGEVEHRLPEGVVEHMHKMAKEQRVVAVLLLILVVVEAAVEVERKAVVEVVVVDMGVEVEVVQ
jgi:hypothetical protein